MRYSGPASGGRTGEGSAAEVSQPPRCAKQVTVPIEVGTHVIYHMTRRCHMNAVPGEDLCRKHLDEARAEAGDE